MTNPKIEAAAKAGYAVMKDHYPGMDKAFYGWGVMPERDREGFRLQARAALVAAAGVTPQELGEPHECTGLAMIGEMESLKRLLDTQRQRGDFWERRYKEAAQVDEAKLSVSVPAVPYGPVGVPADRANAGYYRSAAKNIRYHASRGRSLMGSNLTEAVARLCDATADALYERQRVRGGGQ